MDDASANRNTNVDTQQIDPLGYMGITYGYQIWCNRSYVNPGSGCNAYQEA